VGVTTSATVTPCGAVPADGEPDGRGVVWLLLGAGADDDDSGVGPVERAPRGAGTPTGAGSAARTVPGAGEEAPGAGVVRPGSSALGPPVGAVADKPGGACGPAADGSSGIVSSAAAATDKPPAVTAHRYTVAPRRFIV
jgi:hypothetical protein